MTDFTDDYQGKDEQACIERFEDMLKQKSAPYFDVHEVELIAEHFMEKNNHSMAKRAIDHGLRLHSDSQSLKLCAARVYAINGHLQRAMCLLEEIERIEFQNEEVYLIKASIHSQLKEHVKSIENLQRAAELSNYQQDEILLDMAFEQENQRDFAGAINTLQKALSINPHNDAALHEIGFCFDALNKPAEVIAFYSTFLDNYPYSYAAWYNLGNAYYKQLDYENCVLAYGYCLAIEATFTPALFNKANALIQLERFADAAYDFEASLEIEGPQSGTHCYLGECYEKMEQIPVARMHYNKAIELSKDCSDAHIGLAVLLEMEEKWKESLVHYQRAIELEPGSSGYWHMYATACHKSNEIFDAEAAFLKSLSIDNTNCEAWEDYAIFKAEISGNDKGIKALNEALEINPGEANLLYRLAAYKCTAMRFAEANDLLSLAVQVDPDGLAEFFEYCPEALLNPILTSLTGHNNTSE